MTDVFTGEPEPQEIRATEIRILDDRGDSRVMRVIYGDATDAEPVEATVLQARSIGATPDQAAQAVADRLNVHYPPDARLAVIRERDRFSGEYIIGGHVDAGFFARESRLTVPA